MNKTSMKYLTIVGSIASILALIYAFFPQENKNNQFSSGKKSPNIITTGANTNVEVKY